MKKSTFLNMGFHYIRFFKLKCMDVDLMDEIANTQREYVKARLKAEKTRTLRL